MYINVSAFLICSFYPGNTAIKYTVCLCGCVRNKMYLLISDNFGLLSRKLLADLSREISGWLISEISLGKLVWGKCYSLQQFQITRNKSSFAHTRTHTQWYWINKINNLIFLDLIFFGWEPSYHSKSKDDDLTMATRPIKVIKFKR